MSCFAVVLFSFSIALLSFAFALTWISKRSDLCYFFVGSCSWGFDERWRFTCARDCRVPIDASVACNCRDGDGGGGVYSPFPASGADDLVTRVSWDEKAEMCRLCIEQKFPFCVIVKIMCLVDCSWLNLAMCLFPYDLMFEVHKDMM